MSSEIHRTYLNGGKQGGRRDFPPFTVEQDSDLSEIPLVRSGRGVYYGPWATGELCSALLSMSGSGKPFDLHRSDHASDARPGLSHEDATVQPPYAAPSLPHQSQPRETFALVTEEPASFSYIPTNAEYHPQYSNYMYAPSRGPAITSWTPATGSPGTKLYVYLQHTHEPASLQRYFFFIIFRNKSTNATLVTMGHSGPYYQYVLSVEVPEVDEYPQDPIPLYFNMQDEARNSLAWLNFGSFTYTRDLHTPVASHDHARKRKVSVDRSYVPHSQPTKRPSTQRLHEHSIEQSSLYALPTTKEESNSPADHYVSLSHDVVSPIMSSTSGRVRSVTEGSKMLPSFDYYSTPRSVHSPQAQSSETYTFPTTIPRPFPVTVASRTKTKVSTPYSSGTPQLIRTSTIQPSPDSPSSAGSHPFNPYSMYPHKAVLDIQGDLGAMVENWSEVEWNNRRRLVQFERSQIGNTIATSFEAVTPESRAPNSICISCIWWKEKAECFVTSVDTIYLLESLVAVRFTVEEKNRIRRNLEGFRPLTVSKSKTKDDSEEFFKVIMGFPNPKPRNIEKDVKVFPWKILAHALKKIISKYSASYSSTAGALLPHPSSGASSARLSDTGVDSTQTASPLSVPSPVPSMVATTAKSSASLSPAMPAAANPKASADAFAQHLTAPTTATPPGYRSYGSITDPHYMALPPASSSWDFSSYTDPGGTGEFMASTSTPRYGPIVQYLPASHGASSQPPQSPHYFDPYDPQRRHA